MFKKFSWALYAAAALALFAAISMSGYAAPPSGNSPAKPQPVTFEKWCLSNPLPGTPQEDYDCGYGSGVAAWEWSPADLGLTKGQLLVIEFATYGVYIKDVATQVSLAGLSIGDLTFGGAGYDSFWLAPGDPVVEDTRTSQSNGQQVRLYVDDDDTVQIYLELSKNTTHVSGYASFSGYIIDDGASSLSP